MLSQSDPEDSILAPRPGFLLQSRFESRWEKFLVHKQFNMGVKLKNDKIQINLQKFLSVICLYVFPLNKGLSFSLRPI